MMGLLSQEEINNDLFKEVQKLRKQVKELEEDVRQEKQITYDNLHYAVHAIGAEVVPVAQCGFLQEWMKDTKEALDQEDESLFQQLHRLRVKNNELLKDMADELHLTPAELSAIENEKTPVPEGFVDVVERLYGVRMKVRDKE